MKLGILFNGIVGVFLAVPIVRYLLSPVIRERKPGYESWLSLGGLEQFPAGQTRLATYRNPLVNHWDGETANIPCWVRSVDDQNFQVFAINCAHLGCPVRWFPQSSLFMCPCHGGAYYQTVRAPPDLPSADCSSTATKLKTENFLSRLAKCRLPVSTVANVGERQTDMRLIQKVGEWFDLRLQLGTPIRETIEHLVPRETASWFYVFGSAALIVLQCSSLSPAFCSL